MLNWSGATGGCSLDRLRRITEILSELFERWGSSTDFFPDNIQSACSTELGCMHWCKWCIDLGMFCLLCSVQTFTWFRPASLHTYQNHVCTWNIYLYIISGMHLLCVWGDDRCYNDKVSEIFQSYAPIKFTTCWRYFNITYIYTFAKNVNYI